MKHSSFFSNSTIHINLRHYKIIFYEKDM